MNDSRVPRVFVLVMAMLAGIAGLTLALIVRLYRDVADVAEMLSDAGHGPTPWREDSELDNPYAGAGPTRRDDKRPDD